MASRSAAITDDHVVRVLCPFVRATRPLLDALRESDPFGLRQRATTGKAADDAERSIRRNLLDRLSSVRAPGTPAWAAMDVAQRVDWWVDRVGRFIPLVAAVPGLGGALADRLPVQDALGAAGQGLLLCAIAGEHGIRDENAQVRMLAAVLFHRTLKPVAEPPPEVEQQAAELTAELDESRRKRGAVTLRAVAGTVWRLGRLLWGLGDELGKRPQGRWYHTALGQLPVVGMLGDYLGERKALRRAAAAGLRWIEQYKAGARGTP